MAAGGPGMAAEKSFCAEEYSRDGAKCSDGLGGVFRAGGVKAAGPVRIEYTKNESVVRGEGALVGANEADTERAVGVAPPPAARSRV